jgi:hypothetical protein
MHPDIGPSSLKHTSASDDPVQNSSLSQNGSSERQRNGRGGRRPGAGRKRIQFDMVTIKNLYASGGTNEDIADWFNCSVRTVESRSMTRDFSLVKRRSQATLRVSLRRHQLKLAEKGNAAMQIWLGKQILGQRDPPERALTTVELEAKESETVGIWLSEDDERL